MDVLCRITPQFSGRALTYAARRACIMKWSTRGVAEIPFDGPLQLCYAALAIRSLDIHLRRFATVRRHTAVH
jgi:hypothetical protein